MTNFEKYVKMWQVWQNMTIVTSLNNMTSVTKYDKWDREWKIWQNLTSVTKYDNCDKMSQFWQKLPVWKISQVWEAWQSVVSVKKCGIYDKGWHYEANSSFSDQLKAALWVPFNFSRVLFLRCLLADWALVLLVQCSVLFCSIVYVQSTVWLIQ